VEYASLNDGVMHACGHDVHAAWTIGSAHLLTINRPAGDVVILLQPGEETGRGAPLLIEQGVLDGVAAIFGAHVDMRYTVGQVVAQSGNVAASADEFIIEVVGRGSHAARPHEGTDPVVAAAALVMALQTAVSRKVPPGAPAVVSVGKVEGGTAPNVIPEKVVLSGTLRAAEPEIREILQSEVRQIAHHVAAAHRVSAKVTIMVGTPPLLNDSTCVGWAQDAIERLLGSDAIKSLSEPNLGGEDFAHYLEHVPGCFLRVGSRDPDQEAVPAHTARFLPSDRAICMGAGVLAEAARAASEALANRI
jgi:hippurate hydrolase